MNFPAFRLAGVALAMTLLTAGARAGELNDTEQKLVSAIRARSPQALALLEQSARINSGTMNTGGVQAVGALFRRELDDIGFATRWIDLPADMQRAGHLLAEHKGDQGKRVLLLGHLDTVFEKDSSVPLWQPHGDRVSGQGTSDMKGGDVIILEALRALKAVGALDHAQIRVMFTGDEEKPGIPVAVTRAEMVAAAKVSDVALSFEGTVRRHGQDTATVGRRASGGFVVEVKGRQGHSASVFSDGSGYGANYEAARIVNSFREQLMEPDLTFNIGTILGGTDVHYSEADSGGEASGKTNVIAKEALIHGDLRYLSAEQRDRVRARMREIVAASLPGTSASIRFHENYPPMAPTEGNLKLLGIYSKASEDAGLGTISALAPGERGAGDIQFVAPYVDSLDGLGASGDGAHSPREEMEIASLERAAIRTAILLYRLTR